MVTPRPRVSLFFWEKIIRLISRFFKNLDEEY